MMTKQAFENEDTLDVRHSRPRIGKTNRDRMGEASKRNRENKAKRSAWRNSHDGMNSREIPFPFESCNGKRNRYRVTMGNDTVIIHEDRSHTKTRRQHRRRYAG